MDQIQPLKAVFFDIGGTLGTVSGNNPIKLTPFSSSASLLISAKQTLALRVGIITNIGSEMTDEDVRRLLEAAGLLRLIDETAIVTSRAAGASKPDRKIYTFAARKIGMPVRQCLYIGENPNEVAGAQRAGMAGILKPIPA